jgi:hypothetical protein
LIGYADVLQVIAFTYGTIGGTGWAARLTGAERTIAVVVALEVGAVWGALICGRRHADTKALSVGQHTVPIADAILEAGRPVATGGALVILRPLAGLGFEIPVLPLRAQWRRFAAHGDVVGYLGGFAFQGAGAIWLANGVTGALGFGRYAFAGLKIKNGRRGTTIAISSNRVNKAGIRAIRADAPTSGLMRLVRIYMDIRVRDSGEMLAA